MEKGLSKPFTKAWQRRLRLIKGVGNTLLQILNDCLPGGRNRMAAKSAYFGPNFFASFSNFLSIVHSGVPLRIDEHRIETSM